MTEPARICPHCLVAVGDDGRCMNCGRRVDPGDWPPIIDRDEFAPWLSTGLVEVEGSKGHFRIPFSAENRTGGALRTELPYELRQGKSCVCIGESPRFANILIDNAAPLHAALLLNRRTRTWWIYDCGSGFGTKVNGEAVHVQELQSGDCIEIAGVKLTFHWNRIESGPLSSEGLAISVRDMTFRLPERKRPILDHISFSVAPGEFVGILGPSGCGKSSLVQRLVGLSDDYTGEVLVNGNDRRDVESAFRAVSAYLPQNVDQSLHAKLTLEEEIRCFRSLHTTSTALDDGANAECLAALGLSGREQSRIGSMSGGERRRVGIALALLRKPRFLMLDEPGAGLDPASEGTLMRHLRGIANQGRTVLCVTHILANAKMFDKVLVLSSGRIVYYGRPDALLPSFGVSDLTQLYRLLETGDAPARYEVPAIDRTCVELPVPASAPSLLQVVGGYLRRTWKEFASIGSGGSAGKRFKDILSSGPAVYLLWQPLGLVAGLRLACAYYFRMNDSGASVCDMQMLGFCGALSMFWVGINNTAREFVRDRIPGRCLERLQNVPYVAYVVSKVVWVMSLCLVQTLSFTILLSLAGRIVVPLVESSSYVNFLGLSPGCFFPLLTACVTGAFCGLTVSAVVKRELSAVSIVPNIAILALLFSNSVVRFEDGDGGYVRIAQTMSEIFMPCHWPARVFAAIQDGSRLWPDLRNMLLQFAAYAVVAVILILRYQSKNEKSWDGR